MIARILLIDGDDATRTRYAEFLRSVGFDVTAVSDGHGATVLALASGADVVVTDANPRGAIDGVEVARRLRNDERTRRIRVVVLTAGNDDEGRAKAGAVGCSAVLERRCEPAGLSSAIQRLIAETAVNGLRNGAPTAVSTFSEPRGDG